MISPPIAPPFCVEKVPSCLRQLPRWVCWKFIDRDGKPTKCPVSAKGGNADSMDPTTWTTCDEVLAAFQANKALAGIGFVFTPDDCLCGVDLDDSLDPATGQLKPWAREIVERLNSYTEVSPSGHGVKVFLRARKPGDRCRKGYHDGEVEMYSSGRFFTVTCRRIDTVSAEVESRQAELEGVYRAVFGETPTAPAPAPPRGQELAVAPALSDDDIIRLACASRKSGTKFAMLWAGQWNNRFQSASEADSSVVFTLAFYTKDAAQIDRLFRQSKLYRPKWDEMHGTDTYGRLTIGKALEKVTDQYAPSNRGKVSKVSQSRPASPPPSPRGKPVILVGNVQLRDLTVQGLGAIKHANVPPNLASMYPDSGPRWPTGEPVAVGRTLDRPFLLRITLILQNEEKRHAS